MAVGDLFEEVEEGDLVRAEPRRGVPGANVLDGDGGGGERRQHQPLPEVAAAGEAPALFSLHLDSGLCAPRGWLPSRGGDGGGGAEG